MTGIPLTHITSLARSGALDRAWTLFNAAGYDVVADNPAVFAVKGRLFKDMALRAEGAERMIHLSNAESAYAAAASLDPQPWLLINVATLAALRGEVSRAASVAGEVLALIDAGDVAETPYFIAATRAEAHLLRGDVATAEIALAEAMALDPDGWSDHATTLRQLGLILANRGQDSSWLDQYRPPRAMHFAGHLGIDSGGASEANLRAKVDAMLARENVGFAYGALAAGADIIVAEAVLAAGGQIHLVLATETDEFRRQSVSPMGETWAMRFDRILEQAESVACATNIRGDHEPLATALAAEVAMGAAALKARLLESEAFQLLILDDEGGGANTARQGDFWTRAGRRQVPLTIPRDVPMTSFALRPDMIHPTRRLAAMLCVDIAGTELLEEAQTMGFASRVFRPLSEMIAAHHPMAVSAEGSGWRIAFDDVEAAADAARQIRHAFTASDLAGAGLPLTIALKITGHFALVHMYHDSATSSGILMGEEALLPSRLLPIVAPGVITVTEPFASALFASGQSHHIAEFVGDPVVPATGREVRLFAVKCG